MTSRRRCHFSNACFVCWWPNFGLEPAQRNAAAGLAIGTGQIGRMAPVTTEVVIVIAGRVAVVLPQGASWMAVKRTVMIVAKQLEEEAIAVGIGWMKAVTGRPNAAMAIAATIVAEKEEIGIDAATAAKVVMATGDQRIIVMKLTREIHRLKTGTGEAVVMVVITAGATNETIGASMEGVGKAGEVTAARTMMAVAAARM